VEELRRELLSKAERFYLAFMDQEPRSEQARRDLAVAHLRLGHINRMLERRDDAEREYKTAIARLTTLTSDNSRNLGDRQTLATAFNWLGETLRPQAGRSDEAAKAYDSALALQQALVKDAGDVPQYREELARTLSNRGILRSLAAPGGTDAEADFRESIRLLEPLVTVSTRALQEIGRAANNLAAVLDERGADEARVFYERAVTGHEDLVRRDPDHREYQLELAMFCNNLAVHLHDRGAVAAATARTNQALQLFTTLAQPAPSLAIERADAHNLRGMILREQNIDESAIAFENALDLFADMQTSAAVGMPAFHVRFGDLLLNLAVLARAGAATERSGRLLERGVEQYTRVANQIAESGSSSQARVVVDTLALVIPEVGDRHRPRLLALQEQLRRRTTERGPS
jgi:tetratricopeptide (TPR) repeat protein